MPQVLALVGSFVAVFGFLCAVVGGALLGGGLAATVGLEGGARGFWSAVGTVALAVAWVVLCSRLWRRLRAPR